MEQRGRVAGCSGDAGAVVRRRGQHHDVGRLVGEIDDEYDREAPGVEDLGDGRFRVPAVMSIHDFAEEFESNCGFLLGGVLWVAREAFGFDVMDKLFNHPLRDKGLASFLADWAKFQEGLKQQ